MPGSATSAISRNELRTEIACSTISFELDSRSSRAARLWSAPAAQCPGACERLGQHDAVAPDGGDEFWTVAERTNSAQPQQK